jgi:hypothetical protein
VPQPRVRAWAVVLTVGVAGCDGGRVPSAAVPPSTARTRPQDPGTKVPRPDPALIDYDPATRTLVLYQLADAGAKWLIQLPDSPSGVPVNPTHQFMDEPDADRVAVFYTTAAGQPSPRVSLAEVLAAREARAKR